MIDLARDSAVAAAWPCGEASSYTYDVPIDVWSGGAQNIRIVRTSGHGNLGCKERTRCVHLA